MAPFPLSLRRVDAAGALACAIGEGSPAVSGESRSATVQRVKSMRLTGLSLAVLAASVLAGVSAFVVGAVDHGITYGYSRDSAGDQILAVESVRPGGLAWHEGVDIGFIVMSPSLSLNGDGIDEQLFTPPGAVEAQQVAMAHKPWPLVTPRRSSRASVWVASVTGDFLDPRTCPGAASTRRTRAATS